MRFHSVNFDHTTGKLSFHYQDGEDSLNLTVASYEAEELKELEDSIQKAAALVLANAIKKIEKPELEEKLTYDIETAPETIADIDKVHNEVRTRIGCGEKLVSLKIDVDKITQSQYNFLTNDLEAIAYKVEYEFESKTLEYNNTEFYICRIYKL